MAEPLAEQTGKPADGEAEDGGRSGVRNGFGVAGVVVFLVATLAAILLVMGLSKRLARETIPELAEVPGGFWTVGAALGLITVFGATAGLRAASLTTATTRLTRAWHAVLTAVCCALAFGPFLYLLSGLRSKNCRSSDCAYIPGTGTAFLTYAVSAGLVGWLLYRWNRARAEERRAQERERVRRLRKKGKGKSRAARRR
ncbi:hypothetical protein [Streptomyces sp. NPDC093598]|uniref:hypothetical protein n=1 Tax=Streptomyces sp. NPDC093598 TaxID=3366046 RepID=UPI003811D02F